MIAGQLSPGRKWPRASTTKPVGVCIQLLALRIQKAEMNVPSATMQVAAKCRLAPDFLHAEQHDAEETRFQEEGRQHFIGHQRPDDAAGLGGEFRPVGTELVGHDDARHDAHGKGDGEDLQQ